MTSSIKGGDRVVVMPINLPTGQRVIHGDTPEDQTGGRGALARDTMDTCDALLKRHPEVQLGIVMLYTPRPEGHVGPFDENHTAIVSGDHVNTTQDLRRALIRIIPSLIQLRMDIESDPDKMQAILDTKRR